MFTTHEMHIEEDYFLLLKSGTKTVELRLNDAKRQKINVGDKIRFICKNNVGDALLLSVSKIARSENFTSLIRGIPIEMLGGISEDQQLAELKNFYTTEEEERNGTIALFLGVN